MVDSMNNMPYALTARIKLHIGQKFACNRGMTADILQEDMRGWLSILLQILLTWF